MIVRGISLTLCLALVLFGTLAGCAPPVGEGSTSSVGQMAPPPEAGPAEFLDEEQAPPSTTVPEGDVPDFGDQAPPSTTTQTGVPDFDGQVPPSTTTPQSDVPAL